MGEHADPPHSLAMLRTRRMQAPLGSKERQDANKQVDKIDQKKWKRTPNDRHRLRMKALYVDILSEQRWNRPAQEVSPTEAYDFLIDALNDYGLDRSQRYLELETLKADDPELHDALVQWPDRPQPPHVAPPTFPGAAVTRGGQRTAWRMAQWLRAALQAALAR